MKRSNRLVLLIGFFLAAVAFFAIIFLLGGGGGDGGDREGINETTIVVAAQDIPLGTTITDALVSDADGQGDGEARRCVHPRERGDRPDGHDPDHVRPDHHGHGLGRRRTVDPNIGRLLEPGRRAMSVRVDQVSGVGTLIKPGDRIDLVIGITGADKFPVVSVDPQTDQTTVVPGLNATSVKAIIQNLEVVGTLLPPVQDQEGDENADPNAPALNEQNQIVILAVSAQEAEVIRFAQIDGSITLILRSPDDAEAPAEVTTGITLRQLVDAWAIIPPQIVETVLPNQ